MPENPYFYDYLTAEELLTYFGGLFGYDAGGARAGARRRLLDEVGIGGERRLQLRKFSKGMLQRVGIAQALINDPELVIFDEPMSGLDPLGRRDVRALILRLRDRGCTVFFSSHVLSDAEALCSRVAILAKGRLVTSGRLTEMLAFAGAAAGSWSSPDSATRAGAARSGRARAGWRRSARAATRSSCRSIRRPSVCSADLAAAGARLVSLNPIRDDARGFLRRAGRAPGTRWRRGEAAHEDHRGDRASTCSANRCATRCSTTSCCSRF